MDTTPSGKRDIINVKSRKITPIANIRDPLCEAHLRLLEGIPFPVERNKLKSDDFKHVDTMAEAQARLDIKKIKKCIAGLLRNKHSQLTASSSPISPSHSAKLMPLFNIQTSTPTGGVAKPPTPRKLQRIRAEQLEQQQRLFQLCMHGHQQILRDEIIAVHRAELDRCAALVHPTWSLFQKEPQRVLAMARLEYQRWLQNLQRSFTIYRYYDHNYALTPIREEVQQMLEDTLLRRVPSLHAAIVTAIREHGAEPTTTTPPPPTQHETAKQKLARIRREHEKIAHRVNKRKPTKLFEESKLKGGGHPRGETVTTDGQDVSLAETDVGDGWAQCFPNPLVPSVLGGQGREDTKTASPAPVYSLLGSRVFADATSDNGDVNSSSDNGDVNSSSDNGDVNSPSDPGGMNATSDPGGDVSAIKEAAVKALERAAPSAASISRLGTCTESRVVLMPHAAAPTSHAIPPLNQAERRASENLKAAEQRIAALVDPVRQQQIKLQTMQSEHAHFQKLIDGERDAERQLSEEVSRLGMETISIQAETPVEDFSLWKPELLSRMQRTMATCVEKTGMLNACRDRIKAMEEEHARQAALIEAQAELYRLTTKKLEAAKIKRLRLFYQWRRLRDPKKFDKTKQSEIYAGDLAAEKDPDFLKNGVGVFGFDKRFIGTSSGVDNTDPLPGSSDDEEGDEEGGAGEEEEDGNNRERSTSGTEDKN